MSHNKDNIEKAVNDKIVEFANRGYRSLGVAKADGDSVRGRSFLPLPVKRANVACLLHTMRVVRNVHQWLLTTMVICFSCCALHACKI